MTDSVPLVSLCLLMRNGLNVRQAKDKNGLPISRIETISRGHVDPDKVGYAGLRVADCKQWLLEPGDILFSHINSPEHVGKCALYDGQPEQLVHGMNLLCLRPDPSKVYAPYLLHVLRTAHFREALERYINRAVNQASVSISNLSSIPVAVPPLDEQRRIAAILDQADDLRQKRRRALRRLDGLVKAVFVEMFGDPVSNTKRWPTKRLGEVGELERGVSKHRPRNEPSLLNGPYPLVQTGDIANCDGFIRRYTSSYSEGGLKQSRLWPRGTLCITIAANIGKTGILRFDACFPDSVVGFTPGASVRTEYVQSWMSFVQRQLEDDAPKFAQKNINLAILRDLTIPVPPAWHQEDFAARVTEIDKLRSAQQAHLAKLDELFGSLQQLAFRDARASSYPVEPTFASL